MEEETNELEQSLDLLIQQNKQNFDELQDDFDIIIEQGSDTNQSLDNIFEQNSKTSKLLNQTIKEGIGNLHKVLTKLDSKEQGFLDTSPLVTELKNSSLKLDNLLQAVKANKSEKLSSILTELKEEIEELENFDFDKFKKITDKQTSDLIKATYKVDIDKHKNPKEALAVKFYDKDGEAIDYWGGGGGGYPDVRVKNVNQVAINPATEEKQDAVIAAIAAIPAGGYEIVGLKNDIDGRISPATEDTLGFIKTNTETSTGVGSGRVTVTTPGTQVVLGASTGLKSLTVKALSTNTGIIYIGDSGVSSSNGFELLAGDSISMDMSDTTAVYIDSTVASEGVTYFFVA